MEKLFKSKVAFIAFVIIFTSLLLIVFKDTTARIGWSLSMGALSGFVFAQWYWIEKMKKIQNLIDARMATPEQTELLKRKDDKINDLSDHNMKLVKRNAEIMKELNTLKQELVSIKECKAGGCQAGSGYQPTDSLDTTNPPQGD